MNVKQNSQNNVNINWGQAEEFSSYEVVDNGDSQYIQCSKKKRIKITPLYKVHRTKHDEVYYRVELQLYKPIVVNGDDWGDYQSVTEEAFNVSNVEMRKFMNFISETFALENTPINTFVSVDSKGAVREILRKYQNDKSLFETLSMTDLDTINGNVTLQNLKNIKDEMMSYLDTGSEREHWHPFLKKYSWILSQLFVAPYILFQDEFYVGGQQYNRYGGVKTDFGYKNIETGNCAIIEIKDAKTPLITKYRNTDEFCISNFLAGGISQILKQKDTLYKDYWNVTRNDPRFNVNNIKSILVIGKMPDDDDQRVAFESFRNELNSVEVITFDELLGKIELQIQIIEGTLFQNGSDLWDN